ncbi:hypothetical protein OX90_04965 [Pseudomonas coronafaciens pv. porri]|uniref:Uncharacterized protein n=1 Tax=Pseudomonas coronafaciens pv. porri TaxID=83964 RepID=A0ABR5JTB5_9PSED|nr:hypothetical protein OX88_21500 [Pseudomonas coronafaciens pv. porri]KOP60632.1 hypothetical protein OX90_04965 [Pseudomonas coronafaciens pv. porri]
MVGAFGITCAGHALSSAIVSDGSRRTPLACDKLWESWQTYIYTAQPFGFSHLSQPLRSSFCDLTSLRLKRNQTIHYLKDQNVSNLKLQGVNDLWWNVDDDVTAAVSGFLPMAQNAYVFAYD